ncbi:hypothetical protein FA13DRAFT_1799255 [Coprinellus micaceus]|jgi:hypothetical protein|uniref:Uncharacterized protein n=1 Tax=Coprinellus micaceus TaxID=71717 RepID=A0A4Y7SK54_COPMI|nr:hypothetical protein FA13DRAFT_1799255 [Coprinellus micaceus]
MAAGDVLRSLDQWFVEKLVLRYEATDMHTKAVTTVVEHRYAIGIRSKPMAEQHYVVVVDAPTLLEVARSTCGGVVDIARTLTNKGIACATAKYFPSTTQPRQRAKPREGQGVIQDRRNFSREAYLNYEMCRDNTFIGVKGGLALKEGGVVARLAREVLPDIRPALKPPSRVAHESGRVLGQNRDGLVAISDSLYPADLDAILGRYLNYKGPGLGEQEAATLWPSSSAWDASYLNTGAWNDEAEQWFTRQVQRWRTHLPLRTPDWGLQLKTSKEWKHTMKGTKGLRATWKRYCTLANDYVSRRVD